MSIQRLPLMDISNNDDASSPVTTGRRKSGRAVRAPEKFVPDAPSSQPGAASSKRKRGGEDAENGASDTEGDEEQSDNEVESAAEEEIKERRRKPKATKTTKKPAAKKPKVNGNGMPDPLHSLKLPARPKKAKKVAIADKEAGGLYADVYNSGDSSEEVVSRWLQKWEQSNPVALADLVNLIIKSAGCDIQINEDDINDPDSVDSKLADIQDEYQSQNITDYPLISKAKSVQAFRDNLVGFFDKLIETTHISGLLYEETFMYHLHVWVATMTSLSSRPFRHTATLVGITITTAMSRVANGEIETTAKIQRQLENEKKKKGANKARLAEFQKKVSEKDNQMLFLKTQIKDFFDTMYVHRYRDVDPKIRLECVEALGTWILTFPDHFYDAGSLRYMGWIMSDPQTMMRQEVMVQLRNIMKSLPHSGMSHFFERFRPRLLEIATRDSEPNVRASAVELMDMVRQAGMLEPDDIDSIGRLIYDSEAKVRKAVVGFFAENINDLYESVVEELGGDEVLEDLLNVEDPEDYDTPRAEWIRFKCLAESLRSYDFQDEDEQPSQIDMLDILSAGGAESRFTLAAQALYEKIPDLREWEVLGGYLLFDHSSKSKGSDTERAMRESLKPEGKEELILLETLNAVVKQSLTDAHHADKEKARGTKDKHDLMEAKASAARRLAGLIPRLLKKYGADPQTATLVLRLEHVLNLNVFQELRQDSTVYAKLLDEISAQFNGHADKAVLSEAGAALLHARGYEELEEMTESKVQSLWEDTTSMLRKINKAGQISVRGGFKPSVLTDLSHNLARLERLSSISSSVESLEDDSDTLPISILIDVVSRGVYEDSDDAELDNLEDDVTLAAIRSSMFYFMWKTRSLSESITAGDEIDDVDVDNLKDYQDNFVINLEKAFSSRGSLDSVRLLGAGTLLDLHVLFARLRSPKKAKEGAGEDGPDYSHLQSQLVQEIAPNTQEELTIILDSLEKALAKKINRKLAEPSDDDAPQDFDSDEEEEEPEDITDSERQAETLRAEQQLCELAGKIVLAILAQVIDVLGPMKGKLRSRIQRNRTLLGPNFKEVVAYLDGPKVKAKKSQKSKAQQAAPASKKPEKSEEVVVEDEDDEIEDDPFADVDPEEGTVEDLRGRELLDEELDEAAGSPEADPAAEDEEDDIMGD